MTRRTERIGEQIRGELARLLREEVTDPRVGLITLTRIDVAPDLSHAKIFWSSLESVPHSKVPAPTLEETARGLASAAGFLRSQLSRVLAVRRVPELRFHHDTSLEAGAHTLAILREIDRGQT